MSDYATREPRSLSSSLYSHANSEEHFSEEYFRASVIDGTRHVVRFVLEFFLFTKSKARCIFSTRSERVDCVFHLRARRAGGGGCVSFYLFSGIISKLDQVTERSRLTWLTCLSWNCVLRRFSRRRRKLPGIPSAGRHEDASRESLFFACVYFF